MLAHERTLMAWTRTATSLISFGFTLYTFFHNYGPKEANGPIGPRHYAILMISVGLISLFIATWRHHNDVAEIERDYGAKPRRTAPIVALLIFGLGCTGLIAALFRL
jgi:putative membrane protein